MAVGSAPAAMVISLDFELLWGLRDRPDAASRYGERLRGARAVIPSLLELFDEFDVSATWAIVGFLFAESKDELLQFSPRLRPKYQDLRLSPYHEPVGRDEVDDPLRLAPSLVERIAKTPGQEVATHTFSHYYCGEAGQSVESFRADLEAAKAIAEARGHCLRSIVFPRNQLDPPYLRALSEVGIRCYRGNPPGGSWDFSDALESRRPWRRFARLADSYWGTSNGIVPWRSVLQSDGLSNVRATCFLPPVRPASAWLDGLRLQRLVSRVHAAGREGGLVHFWWHPHNFGLLPSENLAFLRRFLEEFTRARERFGIASLSMAEVDAVVRGESVADFPGRRPEVG